MNERIKELRKYLKLSGEEFGKSLGISKHAISLIETGKNKLTEQNIRAVVREFGVNEIWLRTGEGEMFATLSRDEQITAFIGSIQSNVSETFKKRLIAALSRLKEEEWEMLEKLCKSFLNNLKDE